MHEANLKRETKSDFLLSRNSGRSLELGCEKCISSQLSSLEEMPLVLRLILFPALKLLIMCFGEQQANIAYISSCIHFFFTLNFSIWMFFKLLVGYLAKSFSLQWSGATWHTRWGQLAGFCSRPGCYHKMRWATIICSSSCRPSNSKTGTASRLW